MNIHIQEEKLLSDNWYLLKKYKYKSDDEIHEREVYDRGNGATIFLYNKEDRKILLTRQFRLPTYLNGNQDGMLLECCAGLVEKGEDPLTCIVRETEEEVGVRITSAEKVFESYMSPGAVTEIITFFIAEYNKEMKVHEGGGVKSEQENIEVIEMSFEEGRRMYQEGKLRDAKTVMLFQYAMMKDII